MISVQNYFKFFWFFVIATTIAATTYAAVSWNNSEALVSQGIADLKTFKKNVSAIYAQQGDYKAVTIKTLQEFGVIPEHWRNGTNQWGGEVSVGWSNEIPRSSEDPDRFFIGLGNLPKEACKAMLLSSHASFVRTSATRGAWDSYAAAANNADTYCAGTGITLDLAY